MLNELKRQLFGGKGWIELAKEQIVGKKKKGGEIKTITHTAEKNGNTYHVHYHIYPRRKENGEK